MVVSRLVVGSPTEEHTGRLSDEVELYQRTYNTLLRSSGETHLRVLEPAHRAMGSSLVSSYRAQFGHMLKATPYEEMVVKLRAKVESLEP